MRRVRAMSERSDTRRGAPFDLLVSDTRVEGRKRGGAHAGAMAEVVLATDGYVGDGVAGWAFVAWGAQGPLAEEAGALAACAPHLAEWTAMERALAWAEGALVEGDGLLVRTDSALVAKGLASRRPEMSGEAALARAACRQALARMGERGVRARVERVAREENERADALAREAAHAQR